jgi:hypothetical protein
MAHASHRDTVVDEHTKSIQGSQDFTYYTQATLVSQVLAQLCSDSIEHSKAV